MSISKQRTECKALCTLLDLASEASALSALALIFKPSSSCALTTDTLHPNPKGQEAQTRHQSDGQGELSDRRALVAARYLLTEEHQTVNAQLALNCAQLHTHTFR